MVLLLWIGFLAGVVTAISPCVLPVLPILLASGASGRKPLRVIAGLVASFSVFTLFATWILDKLGLPQDIAAQPRDRVPLRAGGDRCSCRESALIVERPLAVFSRFRRRARRRRLPASARRSGSCSCRAPARCWRRSPSSRRTTTSGCARSCSRSPTRSARRCRCSRSPTAAARRLGACARHAQTVRRVSGRRDRAVALGLVFHVDDHLATLTPGYTTFLQNKIEDNSTAKRELAKVRGGGTALAAVHKTRERLARLRRRAAAPSRRRLDQLAAADARRSCAARSC